MDQLKLLSLKDAVGTWKSGGMVWSAELGGFGPGYEQAIQSLLWELLSEWGDRKLPEPVGDQYPKEYDSFVDSVMTLMDKTWGFSGAQVGAAKSCAWQFLKYGYPEMMAKLEENRRILVSNKMVPNPS